MQNDRRVRRSDNVHEAAAIFLESLAQREGCDAIALASDEGLLIHGWGEQYDLDWLAAISPLGSRLRPGQVGNASEELQSFHINVHGYQLCMACVSPHPFPIDACVDALRRIYAPLLASN